MAQYTAAEIEFQEALVAKLESLALRSAGLQRVIVDGQDVSYAAVQAELAKARKRLARMNGSLPVAAQIKLGGV